MEQWAQRTSGTVGTEDQRNSEIRGPVGTEDQWVQRSSGYRGAVGTEEQWVQMTRGTVGTEDQRNSGNRGTVGLAKWRPSGINLAIARSLVSLRGPCYNE